MQNSRFFLAGRKAPKAWILACKAREPRTPVGRVRREFQHLSPVPLSVYTLAPDISFKDRAHSFDSPTQKNTTVLQSHKKVNVCDPAKKIRNLRFYYGAVLLP